MILGCNKNTDLYELSFQVGEYPITTLTSPEIIRDVHSFNTKDQDRLETFLKIIRRLVSNHPDKISSILERINKDHPLYFLDVDGDSTEEEWTYQSNGKIQQIGELLLKNAHIGAWILFCCNPFPYRITIDDVAVSHAPVIYPIGEISSLDFIKKDKIVLFNPYNIQPESSSLEDILENFLDNLQVLHQKAFQIPNDKLTPIIYQKARKRMRKNISLIKEQTLPGMRAY